MASLYRKSNKEWKRIIDNKMRLYGETDHNKKKIRINKKKAKRSGSGELLDSIVHEELHRKHPKMRERTVQKKATRQIKKMGKRSKRKMYSLYQ